MKHAIDECSKEISIMIRSNLNSWFLGLSLFYSNVKNFYQGKGK